MIPVNDNNFDYDDFWVVSRSDGTFAVVDSRGIEVSDSFSSHAAAWAWIDCHSVEGRQDIERAHRIRNSPSFS